jgi:Sugar fermentation stimulation protein RE domain
MSPNLALSQGKTALGCRTREVSIGLASGGAMAVALLPHDCTHLSDSMCLEPVELGGGTSCVGKQLNSLWSVMRNGKWPPVQSKGTRLDFVLEGPTGKLMYMEVKSVTLAQDVAGGGRRMALFPDTVSLRALRHAQHLTQVASLTPTMSPAYAPPHPPCQPGILITRIISDRHPL